MCIKRPLLLVLSPFQEGVSACAGVVSVIVIPFSTFLVLDVCCSLLLLPRYSLRVVLWSSLRRVTFQ
jgi:hypothetical protein